MILMVIIIIISTQSIWIEVSIGKSEVLVQVPLKTAEVIKVEKARMKRMKPNPSDFEIDGVLLNEVWLFKYLGSRLNKAGTMDDEIERRINIAKWKFSELHKVFRHKRWLSKKTRIQIYKTVVVSALLWDCNNWNLTKESVLLNKLQSFNHTCLLRISSRTRRDRLCLEETVLDSETIAHDVEGIEHHISQDCLKKLEKVVDYWRMHPRQ